MPSPLSPIQRAASEYTLLDRRKGEPINEYFFKKVKDDLGKVRLSGDTQKVIAERHNVGIGTVKLIDKVPNFMAYTELRSESLNKRKFTMPKKLGLFARIIKRIRS